MVSPNVGSRLGTRFGPYQLQELIGMGGMGEVYRAYDTARERMVAIKVLRTDLAADPTFQDRFRRESRVAARLQEPHVIPVHDFGDIDGVLYIDMRLVEGTSLKDELRVNGSLAPVRTVSIISQIASALDAAHASGLIHRDIKPENVLLTADDFAYLVDFGIAHGGGEASVTKTGLVVGSAAYMATERLSGGAGGPASDTYSLTCLLYECLTGRPPYEAADLRQVMSAHMFSPPPRPSVMRQGLNPAFDQVVARGMAKEPGDRYKTAGDLAKAAAAAAARGPATPPPNTRQFSAVDPNPISNGFPPPYAPAAAAAGPPGRSRFGPAQWALVVATVMLVGVAAVLASVLMSSDGSESAPQTRLAAPPSTTAITTTAPTSDQATTTTTSTTPSTSTSAGGAPIAGVSGMDGQGFVGHSARCEGGSTPAAAIRTANSLAIVCETSPGSYYYRGERLRDGAQLQLQNATPAGGGFDAINPADGARYQVRPDELTISSPRGTETDPALEYGAR